MAKRKREADSASGTDKPKAAGAKQPKLRTARQSAGLAGFDFEGLNSRYLAAEEPINDAAGYGVRIQPAAVTSDARCWRVVGVHHLTPDENRSRHNIYLDALDEEGRRIKEAVVRWTWEGNHDEPPRKTLDKPDNEPGADIPISPGIFSVWIDDGAPSDRVAGIHYNHPDERNSEGEIFNSTGHHSFYVVFQRGRREEAVPDTGDDTIGDDGDQGVTDGSPLPGGRIRAGERLGIDANRPIDVRTGAIAPQVADPEIIADTGVGWVRLNFVLGERWSSPLDESRPDGLTWLETYRRIVDGLRGRGLRIYGLISAEAMAENPGDQFRDAVAGPISNDWIGRYAETFVHIAERFHADVAYFESFNEPDDWHGSNRNWVHPDWFAVMLQAVHEKVRNHADPSVRRIRLISGPLQGLHSDEGNNNGNAGAHYLRDTLRAGKRLFDWGLDDVPFPFDGVGYHLYVAQGPANSTEDIRRVFGQYLSQVRQVMRDEMDRELPIFLSEFGWQDSVLGEQRQAEVMDFGLRLVLQEAAIALGFWFCTQDFEEKFGLYRMGDLHPGNRKRIYSAFKTLCNSLVTPPHVTTAPPAVRWRGTVTAALLNVRSGPSVEHAKIGSLIQHSMVEVLDELEHWLQIAWEGMTGFVHGDYVVRQKEIAQDGEIDLLTPPPDADPTVRTVAETWNRYRDLIAREASRLSIDPAVAVAILVAESAGAAFGDDGRMIIRFENHIFYNQWGKANEARFAEHFAFDPNEKWKGHRWRPDAAATWQNCHSGQSTEWLVFDLARRLNPRAAMLSISMGAPQIMGFNHERIGYATVEEMFSAFQSSANVQVASLFRFIAVNGLTAAIQQGDFRRFAAAYNGPGQADHYAAIMQRNLAAFRSLSGAAALSSAPVAAAALGPGAAAAPAPKAVGDEALTAAWRDQVLYGLTIAKQLFDVMLEDVQAGRRDDGLRMAQMAVALNTYWGQLAMPEVAERVENAGAAAVGQLNETDD